MDRWPIVLGAFAAAVTLTAPITLVPVVAAAILAGSGGGLVAATMLAGLVAVVAYCAIFTMLGVPLRRVIVWGLAYILIWEGFIALGGAGVARFAIRKYTRSIIVDRTGIDLDLADFSQTTGVVVPLLAAGVALVRLQCLDRDDLAVGVEHGRIDVVVGEVPAAGFWIVADEDVAWSPIIAFLKLKSVSHRERRDEQELRNPDRDSREPALAVEDTGVALVRLVDDGRGRAPPEVGGDLVASGLERAAQDRGRHGVYRGTAGERWPPCHEPTIEFERHSASRRVPGFGESLG